MKLTQDSVGKTYIDPRGNEVEIVAKRGDTYIGANIGDNFYYCSLYDQYDEFKEYAPPRTPQELVNDMIQHLIRFRRVIEVNSPSDDSAEHEEACLKILEIKQLIEESSQVFNKENNK